MSKHTLCLLVFTALITACGVDTQPDTSSQSQALLGEPYCWDQWGDPIYLDDFNIVLEGTDDCYSYDDPWGGGGGGGGGGETSCSQPVIYDATGTGTGADEQTAWQAASDNAQANARNRCLNSAWICTPHADSTSSWTSGCHATSTGYQCTSYAQTHCSYTYW